MTDILFAKTIPAFAEVYINGNTNAVSVPNGDTFTKFALSAANQGKVKNCKLSLENGNITINKPGDYLVSCTFSSQLGTTDVVWDTAVFINDVITPNLHMRRRFSTSGYTFNVCIIGIADSLKAGDVLDVRSKHNKTSAVSITTEYANISIIKK